MKKKSFLPLAICLLLALGGCARRDSSAGQSQSAPPADGEEQAAVQQDSQQSDDSVAEGLENPELVQQATGIVTEALERAALADEIYRGLLSWNEVMPSTIVEGQEYRLVTDARFASFSDIQAHVDKTFVAGGKAASRFAEMTEARLYMSVNGELYLNTTALEPARTPLLMGSWEMKELQLLEMSDTRIVVRMPTKRMANADGEKELTLLYQNGSWLLDDSYFFI
jgi:hypothetical protein